MEKRRRKINWITLVVYFITGVIISALALFFRNPFTAENTKDALRYWSDITLVSSIILYGLVFLSFSAHQGTFDGLTYSLKYVFAKFIPMPHIDEEISGTYADYKEIRKGKRKPIPIEGLFSATIFLIIAISCFIAYYMV